MSQLDCQPPRLECCVVGWVFSRSTMTRRNSLLRLTASGTSKVTSGVANSGTISGAALLMCGRTCAVARTTSLHISAVHLCAFDDFNFSREDWGKRQHSE